MSYKKALVTGGAGFIGSNLVDRLIEEGLNVAVVDSLSTGRRENVPAKASYHRVDIRSKDLAEVFKRERPEVVFHLAAQASVSRSVREVFLDADVNVIGSINLLEQCQGSGVDRVVYSSTGGALYGEPERLPCDENHSVRPLSPYGASKYAFEAYLHTYRAIHGLRHTILRYGNVYGPRQDPEGEAGVVAIFTGNMLDGGPVSIFGDGLQERDFVYVGDVVEANVLAMRQEADDIFNIGTGGPTNVNEIFAKLKDLTGYEPQANYGPPREGDVYKIYLDVAKAKAGLGWEAKVGLEEGLAETVEFFKGKQS